MKGPSLVCLALGWEHSGTVAGTLPCGVFSLPQYGGWVPKVSVPTESQVQAVSTFMT